MKLLIRLILFTLPTMVIAQSSEYNISSYKEEGTKAPNVHYIGEAWLHPSGPRRAPRSLPPQAFRPCGSPRSARAQPRRGAPCPPS